LKATVTAMGICIFSVSLVFGDYQPLPNTGGYTGVDFGLTMTNYVNSTVDGGGEFYGTVTPSNSSYKPQITNFWCVDDQQAFYFGQTSTANITPLGSIGTTPGGNLQVRYDNVGTGGYTWTNTSVPTGSNTSLALPPDAQQRYQMAAYLIGLYNFSSNSVDNNAIQEAIWAITNNNSGNGSPSQYQSGYSDLSLASGDVNTDVQLALANYQSQTPASLSNWAVVSWGASATGVLNNGAYNASDSANQTFLVQLGGSSGPNTATPEPGFYALLALGLGGLFFATRWKKA
jgi:hypothetical protein